VAAVPPTGPLRDLPIGETAGWAYRLVFRQFSGFLTALAFPFLLLALAQVLSFGLPESGLAILLLPIFLASYCLFSVAWLRFVLLGPEEGRIAFLSRWRGYHWRFLGASLILTLIVLLMQMAFMMVFSVVSSAAPGVMAAAVMIAGPLLMLIVYLRLSFILPAAAVEEPYSLGLSWAHTRGQSLRLLAVLLAVLPIFIPMVLSQLALLGSLDLPESGTEPPNPEVVRELLLQNRGTTLFHMLTFSALQFLGTGVLLTMIARAFTTLTGWVLGLKE
jgi:hypothetical protein